MARKRINILFAMMKNGELYHAPTRISIRKSQSKHTTMNHLVYQNPIGQVCRPQNNITRAPGFLTPSPVVHPLG